MERTMQLIRPARDPDLQGLASFRPIAPRVFQAQEAALEPW